ncbi:hypothetical protein DPMN_058290 [Dreissena polymorpha]|uniref:Uncharacterized protein n=1 Tax=Dreissena polymorpha TaxID=45954 RepID=A0A9D4HFC1_DREPO|nr:hypothetical protein DPMN_058290 [Dreissena polymorpha]
MGPDEVLMASMNSSAPVRENFTDMVGPSKNKTNLNYIALYPKTQETETYDLCHYDMLIVHMYIFINCGTLETRARRKRFITKAPGAMTFLTRQRRRLVNL